MPVHVIERAFAERLELTTDDVRLIDRRRTYCRYQAASPVDA
jgi:hypothetical protein